MTEIEKKMEAAGVSVIEVLEDKFIQASEALRDCQCRQAAAKADAEHLTRKLWLLQMKVEILRASAK